MTDPTLTALSINYADWLALLGVHDSQSGLRYCFTEQVRDFKPMQVQSPGLSYAKLKFYRIDSNLAYNCRRTEALLMPIPARLTREEALENKEAWTPLLDLQASAVRRFSSQEEYAAYKKQLQLQPSATIKYHLCIGRPDSSQHVPLAELATKQQKDYETIVNLYRYQPLFYHSADLL